MMLARTGRPDGHSAGRQVWPLRAFLNRVSDSFIVTGCRCCTMRRMAFSPSHGCRRAPATRDLLLKFVFAMHLARTHARARMGAFTDLCKYVQDVTCRATGRHQTSFHNICIDCAPRTPLSTHAHDEAIVITRWPAAGGTSTARRSTGPPCRSSRRRGLWRRQPAGRRAQTTRPRAPEGGGGGGVTRRGEGRRGEGGGRTRAGQTAVVARLPREA
jgi:hypothetical protein